MSGLTLESIEYHERRGKPLEWSLTGLKLGRINLIVGKNATGRTRTLNMIWNLANQLGRQQKIGNCGYNVIFKDENNVANKYELTVDDGSVRTEFFTIDKDEKLKRKDGILKIFGQDMGGYISFRPPPDELAAVSRRDDLQHPFLNPLHEWAVGTRMYRFGDDRAKTILAIKVNKAPKFQEADDRHVVGMLCGGIDRFGDKYITAIKDDMLRLGYQISEVLLETPDIEVEPDAIDREKFKMIAVAEEGIRGHIIQSDMSAGMFRVLSILAHVNYAQMDGGSSCVLVDDIGEGLDFSRSSTLVDMLCEKCAASKFQLVMTTNDEFVMNHVPIEHWSVLRRKGCHVEVLNVHNSREAFERFKFIGLSNFSFFEMDFLATDQGSMDALANG